MFSLSLSQLDASQSGKWMPTTVRQFLFAPVILLSLSSPRIFTYPHLPQKFQSLVVSIENYVQLGPKKLRSRGSLTSKSPVLDRFSDIFPETSVYVQILELF